MPVNMTRLAILWVHLIPVCIYTTGAVTTAVGQMEQWEIIVGLLCSMYKNMF